MTAAWTLVLVTAVVYFVLVGIAISARGDDNDMPRHRRPSR